MDLRRKPPVLSSPEPSLRTSPRLSVAATSASGSLLTTRARRRLRSPSLHSGNARYRCSATTRFSTASPRNSRRSLLRPGALRWVRAATNRAESRGSYASFSRIQGAGQSAFVIPLSWLCRGFADPGGLLEGREQRDVVEERDRLFVIDFDDPLLAVALDDEVLEVGEIDALDIEPLAERSAQAAGIGRVIAARLFGDLVDAAHDSIVVQVHRRQAD